MNDVDILLDIWLKIGGDTTAVDNGSQYGINSLDTGSVTVNIDRHVL